MIRIILTYRLRIDSPPPPPPTTEEVPRWWEGRFRLPGGRDAVWEQILKMLLLSAEKLQSAYNT
jgi:hypothetical protein